MGLRYIQWQTNVNSMYIASELEQKFCAEITQQNSLNCILLEFILFISMRLMNNFIFDVIETKITSFL